MYMTNPPAYVRITANATSLRVLNVHIYCPPPRVRPSRN